MAPDTARLRAALVILSALAGERIVRLVRQSGGTIGRANQPP
jgi:hypothetical protein